MPQTALKYDLEVAEDSGANRVPQRKMPARCRLFCPGIPYPVGDIGYLRPAGDVWAILCCLWARPRY